MQPDVAVLVAMDAHVARLTEGASVHDNVGPVGRSRAHAAKLGWSGVSIEGAGCKLDDREEAKELAGTLDTLLRISDVSNLNVNCYAGTR